MKQTYKWLLTFITVANCMVVSSCDFRVVKQVGPQHSSSVETSNRFEAFHSTYLPIDTSLDKKRKYRINEVFAEHQYRHDGDLFSGFEIKDDAYQIIITDSLLNKTWSSDSSSFSIVGFKPKNDFLRVNKLHTSPPDTLKLTIVIANFETGEKEVNELIYVKDTEYLTTTKPIR